MEESKELLSTDSICNRVYTIRGQQVMLDYDLAEIYGYEVKRLNEQVKRNINRFPNDFMFQLEEAEFDILKSQFATSSWGGKRKLPYAFTEQGIYMLATVLRGELAEKQSIFIMRAFREMRHYIKQNQQFVTQSEMRLVTAKVSEISAQMTNMTDRQKKNEQEITDILRSIDTISENFISDRDCKNFVIYKGQKFEADLAYIDIYQQATTSIYVVDDYMDAKTLQLLSQKRQGVEVILFTENGHGRFIVIDYGMPTEQAYHCGASSKDAGKKLCAINKLENSYMIHPPMDKLLTQKDKKV
ncbi:MAG: ORF6N domain-containing protein [Lachnospiraceae bacterium]|nr:ORF6N domain-containing protein [Lachnospiraceae bacterium]